MNMTRVDSLIDPQLRSSLDLMHYSMSFLVSHTIPPSAQVSFDSVTSWLPLLSPPAHAVYFPIYFVTCHLVIGPGVFMRRFYIIVTWKASSTWSFDPLQGLLRAVYICSLNTLQNVSMLFFHSSNPSCTKLHASSSLPYPPSSCKPGHFLLLYFAFPSWSLLLPVYPRCPFTSSFLSLH